MASQSHENPDMSGPRPRRSRPRNRKQKQQESSPTHLRRSVPQLLIKGGGFDGYKCKAKSFLIVGLGSSSGASPVAALWLQVTGKGAMEGPLGARIKAMQGFECSDIM